MEEKYSRYNFSADYLESFLWNTIAHSSLNGDWELMRFETQWHESGEVVFSFILVSICARTDLTNGFSFFF